MLFNSLEFLLFFPIVTLLYFALPHPSRWLLLLIASCIFYAAFIPVYLIILGGTIVVDYIAGIMIEGAQGEKKKQYLWLSIFANIGVLAVFKYYNFFIGNFTDLFSSLGINLNIPLLEIALPIGLSFHTFQAMSYTIEVYRGNQKAERHFGIYALYVMFYPQLVAGPIERPQNILHQFYEKKSFNPVLFADGFRLMLWGLFKKVVIADRLSIYVNIVFLHPENYHYLNLLLAAIFFAIQIYCDFSGYSDIAIGAARTMGFELMTNFNRPYFAKNIQEFWSRWHISLSTWFRDYVYIPLGGNRKSINRTYVNVAIVFLLSGFWHGANWTFIVWGGLHAVFIVMYMMYRKSSLPKLPDNPFFNAISLVITFLIVTIAWVYFRAESVTDANVYLRQLMTLQDPAPFKLHLNDRTVGFMFNKFSFACIGFGLVLLFFTEKKFKPNLNEPGKFPLFDFIFCALLTVLIVGLGVFKQQSFIYFQF